MRLEIDERDTIEFIVIFKERLNRLEEKIDAILSFFLADKDESDPGMCQVLSGGVSSVGESDPHTFVDQDLDSFSIYAGGVIPTVENLCLYGAMQFLDIDFEGEEDDPRRFVE
jgi:hypothetical protein